MNEIICPRCTKAFKIDEAGYSEILKQVRDRDFDEQLRARLQLAEREKTAAVELAKSEAGSEMQKTTAAKDAEIQKLKAQLDAGQVALRLAVTEAQSVVEKERDALANQLSQAKQDSLAAFQLAEANTSKAIQETTAAKDTEIQELRAKLQAVEVANQLEVTKAVTTVEKERDELANRLKQAELEKQVAEKSLKDKYETQIKDRDEAIERLRDMKTRLSTKMVGETLEQHCETEFNRIRSTAFPRSYFEKDNDASTGSKGDYIFRDSDEAGTEIVSIMFEMKNENDATSTKKKTSGTKPRS